MLSFVWTWTGTPPGSPATESSAPLKAGPRRPFSVARPGALFSMATSEPRVPGGPTPSSTAPIRHQPEFRCPKSALFEARRGRNLSGFSHNSLIGTETALTQLRWNRERRSPWPPGLFMSEAPWSGAAPWNRQQEITLSSGYWCGSLYATLDSGLGPTYLAFSQT